MGVAANTLRAVSLYSGQVMSPLKLTYIPQSSTRCSPSTLPERRWTIPGNLYASNTR